MHRALPQGTAPGALLLEAVDWPGVWRGLRHDVTMGACQEWNEGNVVQRTFRAATFPVLLPFYVLLRLTVPMVDPGSYSQQWLAASLLCCPLASVIYFHAFQMWAIVLAMVVGAAAAGLIFWATREAPEEPPELRFRGGFAWGPAVFSLLGFFVGVLWIDSVASEVVGVISFLASLANAPAGVMGLTLMAWGNSLGDMFGNLAMAKAGQTSMAFTACFACPLFNMLMALALGYSSYFSREGVSQVNVELTPEVALGCVFLMAHCGVIVAVGLLCGRRLPQQFYIFSRVWYGLYFVLACWLGLSHR
jgi:sodium/potassium/calcium exchanger 6